MRLKTFNAPDMNQALRQVRDELGENAIILSTSKATGGKGITLTVAVEKEEEMAAPGVMALNQGRKNNALKELEKVLHYHGVPQALGERIIDTCRYTEFVELHEGLAQAIEAMYTFTPLALDKQRAPLMVVGPPGVGKTLTIAKLATQAAMNKQTVHIISTDVKRAGGVEQLQPFADILQRELICCESPEVLHRTLDAIPTDELILIDSFGVNPYDDNELNELGDLVFRSDIEPILVIGAGGDANEAADIASAFSFLGPKRMLITRTASARRFGGLLTAANALKLGLAGLCIGAKVTEPVTPMSAEIIANLILPKQVEKP